VIAAPHTLNVPALCLLHREYVIGNIQPCFPVMLWLYDLVLFLAHMIRLNCIFARHVVTPFCTVTLTG
jgi:hypothetical protein